MLKRNMYKWTTLVVISVLFVILHVSKDLYGAVKDGQIPRDQKIQIIHSDVKRVYSYHCAHCHGDGGKGDGRSFPIEIKPKPRDFADATYMATLKDDDIKKVIIGGSTAVKKSNLCPAWGRTFDDNMIKGLVAYVRAFSGPPPSEVKKPVEGATNSPKETQEGGTGAKPFIVWAILVLISGFLIWRVVATREHISFLKGRS